MSDIKFNCPHCGEKIEAPADIAGEQADCPTCGESIQVPDPEASAPKRQPRKTSSPAKSKASRSSKGQSRNDRMQVVVTDIRMPFLSMVVFMVKWSIAAIPAIIIMMVLGLIFFAILTAIGLGTASM